MELPAIFQTFTGHFAGYTPPATMADTRPTPGEVWVEKPTTLPVMPSKPKEEDPPKPGDPNFDSALKDIFSVSGSSEGNTTASTETDTPGRRRKYWCKGCKKMVLKCDEHPLPPKKKKGRGKKKSKSSRSDSGESSSKKGKKKKKKDSSYSEESEEPERIEMFANTYKMPKTHQAYVFPVKEGDVLTIAPVDKLTISGWAGGWVESLGHSIAGWVGETMEYVVSGDANDDLADILENVALNAIQFGGRLCAISRDIGIISDKRVRPDPDDYFTNEEYRDARYEEARQHQIRLFNVTLTGLVHLFEEPLPLVGLRHVGADKINKVFEHFKPSLVVPDLVSVMKSQWNDRVQNELVLRVDEINDTPTDEVVRPYGDTSDCPDVRTVTCRVKVTSPDLDLNFFPEPCHFGVNKGICEVMKKKKNIGIRVNDLVNLVNTRLIATNLTAPGLVKPRMADCLGQSAGLGVNACERFHKGQIIEDVFPFAYANVVRNTHEPVVQATK